MDERILVIAAHPDDEALGCGATLKLHAERGDDISILFLADGVSARDGKTDGLAARQAAAQAAAKLMGARRPLFLTFPDNRLDTVPLLDLAKAIEEHANRIKPTVAYIHHGGDLNVDHRRAHQAAMTAFRPLPNGSVRKIYAFETMSSTEWSTTAIGPAFHPDRFVDIARLLDLKLELLDIYNKEMREFPHPRSAQAVRSLALWRGASAGLGAAEAFKTIRCIESES